MRALLATLWLSLVAPHVAFAQEAPSFSSEEFAVIRDFRDWVKKIDEPNEFAVATTIIHERVDGWVEPALLTREQYKILVSDTQNIGWTFFHGLDADGLWLARRADFVQCGDEIPKLGLFLYLDNRSDCRFASVLYRPLPDGSLEVRLIEGLPRQPSPSQGREAPQ